MTGPTDAPMARPDAVDTSDRRGEWTGSTIVRTAAPSIVHAATPSIVHAAARSRRPSSPNVILSAAKDLTLASRAA
jgi:hypothetical protein